MTTQSASVALSPFQIAAYFRDEAPRAAKRGMLGYVLRLLLDMTRLKGEGVGQCFPSVPTLAEACGRSVRHVRRTLAALEALGVIERITRRRPDGGFSSNIYRLRGLLAWAAKNVRGVPDKGVRKTCNTGKTKPTRGGFTFFNRSKSAKDRRPAPAQSGPVSDGPKQATFAPAEASRRSEKWESVTVEQIEEAQRKASPVEWAKLRAQIATSGGIPDHAIDAMTARAWRFDAILRGVL